MLSAYELDRLKNIQRNEEQLEALGLKERFIPTNEPKATKAPKRPRSPQPQSSVPVRTSSRLAGKEVDYTYAESVRYLDEIDPDEDRPRKRGRPSRAPDRYDDENYKLPTRKRVIREHRPNPAQQRAELIARLPPQAARMPSNQKIMELRDAFVTEQQLVKANYPQTTIDTYKNLLIERPFRLTDPTCDYDLMPFELYESNYTGKFKVQCNKCKEYYCLNKQGKIHLHSRCEQIAKAKKEAEKTAAPVDDAVDDDADDDDADDDADDDDADDDDADDDDADDDADNDEEGATGVQDPQGADGPQGSQGDTGATGVQGPQGADGCR